MKDADPQPKATGPIWATDIHADGGMCLRTLSHGEALHAIEPFLLVFVLGINSGVIRISGSEIQVCCGELVLLPNGSYLKTNGDARLLTVRLNCYGAKPDPHHIRDPLIALLLQRTWELRLHHLDIVESSTRLLETLVEAKVQNCVDPRDVSVGLDPRIAAVVSYIEAHFNEPLTVTGLASVACLSPSHFARLFKSSMGESVWRFVQRRRCERAQKLLGMSRMPISEIAYACGFADQAHLTTTFRSHCGISPSKARREWAAQ